MTSARLPKPRLVGPPRPLTRDDLAVTLAKPYVHQVVKLRDSHHRVARLLAAGLREDEVVRRSGYSSGRVYALRQSPAFIELVDRYRSKVNAAFETQRDEFAEFALTNMLTAERQLSDRLEAADEGEVAISTKDLVALVGDRADRFGYGKRNTTINVNADFATELERAIARSGKTTEVANVIEVAPVGGQLRRRL